MRLLATNFLSLDFMWSFIAIVKKERRKHLKLQKKLEDDSAENQRGICKGSRVTIKCNYL